MSGGSKKRAASEALADHDQCEAITIADTYSATFYWRIRGCGYLDESPVVSGKFQTFSNARPGESMPLLWHFKLHPKGLLRNGNGRPGKPVLELHCNVAADHKKPCASVSVSVTINVGSDTDASEIVKDKKEMFKTLKLTPGVNRNTITIWDLFDYETVSRDPDTLELLEKELVITCTLRHSGDKVTTASHRCANEVTENGVIKDLAHAFDNGLMTDAEIEVGEKTYCVHRLVLATRSSVFKKLFYGDFEEAITSKVCIDDMSARVCRLLLNYIYGKRIRYIALTDFEDVLDAAEKYELDGLKSLCAKRMCSIMGWQSACSYYVLSDRYRVEALKACCASFITFHKRDVMKSEGWERLQAEHPHLFDELSRQDG